MHQTHKWGHGNLVCVSGRTHAVSHYFETNGGVVSLICSVSDWERERARGGEIEKHLLDQGSTGKTIWGCRGRRRCFVGRNVSWVWVGIWQISDRVAVESAATLETQEWKTLFKKKRMNASFMLLMTQCFQLIPCMAHLGFAMRLLKPQKASSSLRYIKSNAAICDIPWQ